MYLQQYGAKFGFTSLIHYYQVEQIYFYNFQNYTDDLFWSFQTRMGTLKKY